MGRETEQRRAIDDELRTNGGLIKARAHPRLRGSIDRLVAGKKLRPLLPGVYVDPSRTVDTR